MRFVPSSADGPGRGACILPRAIWGCVVMLALFPRESGALPRRLILAVDGVPYRDMKALQEGVAYTDHKGRKFYRKAFDQGYFPASRLVSTFPSASDVAWTEIFGNRPLPGYQRTYFSRAANAEIFVNGVTSSMEYERQMTWQVESGIQRGRGYVFPIHAYRYELRKLINNFLNTNDDRDNYYALIRTTDDGQHLSVDIFVMLCVLDEKLKELQVQYKAREGRDLEILILSDHGNNHAGPARRVAIRPFLKQAGYRISESIRGPKDVVLPTAGIESWVELHNDPTETERLADRLWHMEGVDVLTARVPEVTNRFLVLNARGERAEIEWNRQEDSFRYEMKTGDPLEYRPALEALRARGQLNAAGFASADAWAEATFRYRYPLALERIARGHTRGTLNPATILISLKNEYVHAGWFIKKGSEFVRFGGTHGALDDLNSTGMLISNFAPTRDTSANRVAALYGGFPGLNDFRARESGAEWVRGAAQAMTTIARGPLDWGRWRLPADGLFLRVWTPDFTTLGMETLVELTVTKARQFLTPEIRRGDPKPTDPSRRVLSLREPVAFPAGGSYERVYALPEHWNLEPRQEYRVAGKVSDGRVSRQVFNFRFWTDDRGLPTAY